MHGRVGARRKRGRYRDSNIEIEGAGEEKKVREHNISKILSILLSSCLIVFTFYFAPNDVVYDLLSLSGSENSPRVPVGTKSLPPTDLGV